MDALREVLHSFFNPHDFRLALPDVWAGFQLNLKMMVAAEVLVLVLALGVAIVRGLPGRGAAPLRALAIVYTDVFRGTPLILVAFLIGFGLPGLELHVISTQSNFVYGVTALTLVYTAYVTEVYRAGIESVHPSQRMAARSLGLTYWQAMRHVVIPQAVRRVIPPLLNDFVGLQKDTALVTVIGVAEAAQQAQNYSQTYFNFTSYVVAAVFFIFLTIPLARFTDHLIARRELRERAAAL
jgi:polar amino acid transport system permease protein